MKRFLVVCLLFSLVLISCGSKPLVIEVDPGVIIQISGLSNVKGKIEGYVQVVNKSSSFFKISNQELFLYCNNDSARAFMKMPGEWEIDKGLINVMKGKELTYNAVWPLKNCKPSEIQAKYVKFLSRETDE